MKEGINVRYLRLGLLASLLGAILPVTAKAEPAAPAPELMLRNFHHWYVGEALANRDPLSGNRKELMRMSARG